MIQHYDLLQGMLAPAPEPTGNILLVSSPEASEKALLQEQFFLDDYDWSSTLDPDEVPRLDASKGRLLLIWKVPESAAVAEAVELGVKTMGLVLAGGRVAVIRSQGTLNTTDREFRALQDPRDFLLGILLHTVRHFLGHLRVIRRISEELEKKITVSMENRHLLQMFALTESLVYYVDALEANGAVLTRLRTLAQAHGFQPHHLELLDDIVMENAQATRQAEIFSSVLSGLMDARGTVVNNNMNVLLKNLTLINIVFLPLNLIASIGGMSEFTMMTGGLDWRISYGLFCLGMVALGWATWLFMKRAVDRPPKAR